MKEKKKKEGRAVPNERWERPYNPCAPSKNMKDTQGSDFDPKKPTERKTVYVKINDQDY